MKHLIVIRHARPLHPTTENLEAGSDCSLSPAGQKQAAQFAEFMTHEFSHQTSLILSSPKKRCQETVVPLAEGLGLSVQSWEILNEGGSLREKSKKLQEWWKENAPPLAVLCSHGDLIPVLCEVLIGVPVELGKGQWLHAQLVHGKGKLIKIFQETQ